MTKETISAFDQLALSQPILKALDAVGYEKPSPIQAQTIPLLLEGKDMVGQAQTGTGKTAAFALPALSAINLSQKDPQVLVLTPTRELAIQVAEAFATYAAKLKGFHVLPIYGGQDYRVQTRALERGVHVVVGTPGRVMDHMRRGTLRLQNLTMLTLDEADEMLRMGFIDDVEWILEKTPDNRQIALFSATMPAQIRRIATKYLNNPEQVTIEVKTSTAETIRQRYWPVTGRNKLDAMTRILEAEEFDAMLIFVRTKTATVELSEKLEARGYACAPLNGDIQQKMRERTVDQLKKGKLDIIVATDVAARGLDVQRISHVLNYDIPYDTEAYVHRIGRTGRAGRSGDAILFVAPREKRMMQSIERATGKKIDLMEIPSSEKINEARIVKFKQRIKDTIDNENLGIFNKLIKDFQAEQEIPAEKTAAALAYLLQGDTPFLFPSQSSPHPARRDKTRDNKSRPGHTDDRQTHDSKARENQPRQKGRDHTQRDSAKIPLNEARTTRSEHKPEKAHSKGSDTTANTTLVKTTRSESTGANSTHNDRKPVRSTDHEHSGKDRKPQRSTEREATQKPGMERYRLEVGTEHGVEVSNIVGAISNEAGIDSQYIGSVRIKDNHSFIDLPEGMPKAIFKDLRKAWVCGQKLQISKVGGNKNDDSANDKSSNRRNQGQLPQAKRTDGAREKPRKTLKTKPGSGNSKKTKRKGRGLKSAASLPKKRAAPTE